MQLIQLSTCLTALTSFAIFRVFQFVRKCLTLFCQYKYASHARLYINCQCVQKVLDNYCDDLQSLLLGSMYFWYWLIQLNRSYKYNARTGISTLNGHISDTVLNFEKLKKIRCNYFSILGLDRWFRNFPQCVFGHFWLIWAHFWSFFGC